MSNLKIVIVCPGDKYSPLFVSRITSLIDAFNSNKIDYCFVNCYHRNIYEVRNKVLGGHPELNNKKLFRNDIQDYTHLLWLDNDIIFTPQNVFDLLNHNKQIISGLYLMADGVQYAAVEKWDEEIFAQKGTFHFLTVNAIKNRKLPFRVSYVGMGFMLIQKNIIETLTYPWFDHKLININNIQDFCMEDVSFCLRLQNKGYKIWVDPTVIVGHEKTKVLI